MAQPEYDLIYRMLSCDRWDVAFDVAWFGLPAALRAEMAVDDAWALAVRSETRHEVSRAKCYGTAVVLFKAHAVTHALAWQMLASTPRRADSLTNLVPQLQWIVDQIPNKRDILRTALRHRMDYWILAAGGVYFESPVSIFATIANQADNSNTIQREIMRNAIPELLDFPHQAAKPTGPHVVVMAGEMSTKLLGGQDAFKEIIDLPLPLVVVDSVERIRNALLAEFPHAEREIGLMVRDLRDGQPARPAPMLLVGPPGSGKSRLARRYAEVIGLPVFRFDAAGTADGTFAGSSKVWRDTQPSIPARAVAQRRIGNVMVLVDEIDHVGGSDYVGRLWEAMLPFLERETSARYRDTSLDAQLDLSWLVYISTANDDAKLPEPLRDRLRTIRMPKPTLAHLPALVGQLMRSMEREAGDRAGWLPDLEQDELAVVGKAWARSRFSLRKLQKIVAATVQARDEHPSMRH